VAKWTFRGWAGQAIDASLVRFDIWKMEQWGSESDFFKVTGSGVKRGFRGEGASGFSRFGNGQGCGDGSGGWGLEVKVPALRFAIGQVTQPAVAKTRNVLSVPECLLLSQETFPRSREAWQ